MPKKFAMIVNLYLRQSKKGGNIALLVTRGYMSVCLMREAVERALVLYDIMLICGTDMTI